MRRVSEGWTEDRVEEMKKLWRNGWSASEIAKKLGGVSRNAVIGKIHRLRLARHRPASPRKVNTPTPVAPQKANGAAPRKSFGTRISAPTFHPVGESLAPIEIPSSFVEMRATFPKVTGLPDALLKRAAGQCEFPVGDVTSPDFHYCTNAKGGHSRYCAAHHRAAYQPQTVKQSVHRRIEKQARSA